MKPKTKLEKQVVSLSGKLKPVSEKQLSWGYDHCLEKKAVVTSKVAYCLECGDSWDHKGTLKKGNVPVNLRSIICQCCGKPLKILQSKARSFKQCRYLGIMTTCGGHQVYRFIMLKKVCKVGQKAIYTSDEVMQHWIHSSGKVFLIARPVFSMSYVLDSWILGSEMELRSIESSVARERLTLTPEKTYPLCRYIPELKRNGFTGKLPGDVSPTRFFHRLLSDPEIETLLKAGQKSMLLFAYKYSGWGLRSLERMGLWNSVKICLRNNYLIKDASLWVDYVRLLGEFNKDLTSSHFVCPVDLKASHDVLVEKKRKLERQKRLEEQRREILESQPAYEEQKGKFFGLAFTQGALTVEVLKSVEEFMNEGDLLHHCVFVNGYYKKASSLVLSARIDNQPVETVEISLDSLEIIQSRGRFNQPSEHHDQVISLVSQNLPQIGRLVNQ